MKTKQILLAILTTGLSCYPAFADELTNNPSHLRIVRHGNYVYTYTFTSNGLVYVNPSEFWNGVWKEDRQWLAGAITCLLGNQLWVLSKRRNVSNFD